MTAPTLPPPTHCPQRHVYVVYHHAHRLSPEYQTMTEAELFRLFSTPATDDYRIRLVHATSPTTGVLP